MRRLYLPLTILLVVCLVMVGAATAAEPGQRPQKSRVTSPGAAVRSGPADSYYLTDTLPEDTVVEVYRQQPDGWCAIRPPAESFSWVFAQHVRLVGDGLAEIQQPDVAARVGSRLSTQRDVVQVRLRKGETVAILGRDERDEGLWYKIAPPAGEFRWVQAKDIGLVATPAEVEEPANRVTPASAEEPVKASAVELLAPPLAAKNDWSAAARTEPAADITPIAPSVDGPSAPTTADLAAQLRDLELRLSRMVAESPSTWNVTPLEQTAEQLLARSNTVEDREAVKVTLAKIDRFAAIQRRYAAVNGSVASVPNGMTVSGVAPSTGMEADSHRGVAPAYDAVGILRPVVSRRPGAPQYALVNAQGQVVTFVTPTPDVNLQPYIGQQIGVTGSRGYIPEFRRAHVTAGRVAPLNQRTLR